MPHGHDAPDSDSLRALTRAVAELRAELLVTEAALALTVARLAKLSPEPEAVVGDLIAQVMGFADAAARGLSGAGRPDSVTAAAERFADWSEAFLRTPG